MAKSPKVASSRYGKVPEEMKQNIITVGTVREASSSPVQTIARSLTTTGVEALRAVSSGQRYSSGGAGVMSMGFAGQPAGAGLPSVLATGSPLSVFQYTLSRADRLALYRYFARCFCSSRVPITMGDGTLKPLEEVEPGDSVLNALGGKTQVSKVTRDYYEGAIVNLRWVGMQNSESLEVTPEHPFYVLRKEKVVRERTQKGGKVGDPDYIRKTELKIDFTPEWVEAKDVQKGDMLVVPQMDHTNAEIPEAQARLLGYYLAEGNPNFKPRSWGKKLTNVTWSFCVEEEDLIEEVCELVREVTGEEPLVFGPYEGRESVVAVRTREGNKKHQELAVWLFKMGGENARRKKLHSAILALGDESVKHILACWLNGDGTSSKDCAGQLAGTSCSADLANQLYMLMVRVGLTAAKYEGRSVKDGEDKGPKWVVYIPAQYGNLLAGYTKWEGVQKSFRNRKFNYDGNMLLPVTQISEVPYKGDIHNLETKGATYGERTFLVYGVSTHNTDPFVGRALELHSELPLSRLTIGAPKGPSNQQNKEVNRIYENQIERLGYLEFLLEFAREFWLIGDVYVWHEWDDDIKEWSDIYILPAEYCHTVLHPFLRRNELIIFARPLVDTASIRRMTDRDLYMVAGDPDLDRLIDNMDDELPDELRDLMAYGEGQALNTDPAKGSFCAHIARNRPPNEAYGSSVVERCLETLLRLENLKNAQMQISGRNMQPKHLIYGENLSPGETDDLRNQVDLSLLEDVDYPIVTNYPVHWETIGSNQRMLQVDTEYATLREDLATGLGSTKEMLTGASTYSGQRITLELMNTQYLTFRELVKTYTERCVFRPVAEAKGHYFYEEIDTWVQVEASELEPGDEVIEEYDGKLRKRQVQVNKNYNHSQLRFNRLSVRDNSEVYDQLFQLHQKGSLALQYLLDLHNIDSEENATALLEDMGTVRDPVFNRLIENIYGGISDEIITDTNIVERVITGLNLDLKSQLSGEATPGTSPEGLAGGSLGSMPNDFVGDMGSELPELGMEEVPGAELGLPGQPVAVPPVGGVASYLLPGKRLSSVQVERLSEAGRKASSKGKKLTPSGIKRVTARAQGDNDEA